MLFLSNTLYYVIVKKIIYDKHMKRRNYFFSFIIGGFFFLPTVALAAPAITVGTEKDDSSEAGGAAEMFVLLESEPAADVTIPVSSSDTTEGEVSTESLVFNAVNWDTPQTITVEGQDDFIADGDVEYSVQFEPAISEDADYNGLQAEAVSLVNTDNDTAAITVNQTGEEVYEEGGEEVYFSVILESEPTEPVTIEFSSDEEIAFDVDELTFQPEEWDTRKYVYVTAVDDADVEEVASSSIAFTVLSEDDVYNNFLLDTLAVDVVSDDIDMTPSVIVDGKYIKVLVNGIVVDQEKVEQQEINTALYKLKTRKLYPNASYTTVAYLRVKKGTAKLIVFRLTEFNKLKDKVVATIPIPKKQHPTLQLRPKKHRIVMSVGKGDHKKMVSWKLTKQGALKQL